MISNFSNSLKTWTLLAALGGLFVAVGGLIGGQSGLVLALVVALGLNVFVYWKSDTLALKANGARELRADEQPRLRQIVADLANRAGLPMPRLYIVERPEPNAFATGRDPNHAAVAVTTGILELMDERELRGVLAHELSHVKNRDTLIGTIAATIGGAISFLAQMAQFQMLFGGGRDDRNGGGFGALVAIILAPIAALIIQLAVSRGREYGADRSGALLTGDPEGLASALQELECRQSPAAGAHGPARPAARRSATVTGARTRGEPGVRPPLHRQSAVRPSGRWPLLDPSPDRRSDRPPPRHAVGRGRDPLLLASSPGDRPDRPAVRSRESNSPRPARRGLFGSPPREARRWG